MLVFGEISTSLNWHLECGANGDVAATGTDYSYIGKVKVSPSMILSILFLYTKY